MKVRELGNLGLLRRPPWGLQILERQKDRKTDQTDRQTDRQPDNRETARPTNETYRQICENYGFFIFHESHMLPSEVHE